jgi:PTH1 family peptidyl-tRNA hydrolase
MAQDTFSASKYLIVGLGNPGMEYELTRHNIGFLVVDALAEETGASFKADRLGDIAQGRIKNKAVYLLKPNTYMNLSGKAVRYWMQELNIAKENILVITDDIALPVGKLRMRTQGSAGGHNGLTNIEELINSKEYPRLRFGVGSDYPKGRQVEYVLGRWKDNEWEDVKISIGTAAEAAKSFVLQGAVKTMEVYNR